jgi:3-hydroxy-9,10-secoandrosta-1,3,5(10)-triene-9,17-dione monooxygenase
MLRTKSAAGSGTAPDYATLRARAEALIPKLKERAAETEKLGRLPDATIDDLQTSGLFRMHQPARVGGSELPFRAICELPSIVAQGCASTGWVLANLASHHWMLGFWPKEAQDELWGTSRDVLIGSALIYPCGRAKKVEGGYRLSGRWPFSSGIDPSTWNMIGAVVYDEESGHSENRILIVPAKDYTILDTWQVIGLAGTGSKDVVVEDAFVPEHRTLSTQALTGGEHPGSAVNKGTLYRLPAISLFPFVIAGVPMGIARGAVTEFAEATRTKLSNYSRKSLADLSTMQMRIAEAAALVDSAEALMFRDCDEATAMVEAGRMPDLERRARYRRDGAYGATICTQAVDLIFAAAGGGAIYQSNPLQRSFRDIHAANAHFMLNWDVNGAVYGRVALGLSPDVLL